MEKSHTFNGLNGRLFWARGAAWAPPLFSHQTFVTSRDIRFHGEAAQITVKVRFDDDCKNGQNTFSITADVVKRRAAGARGRRDSDWLAGGCLHDDIAKHFPELAHLIRWHLCSSDGPMHYVANTVYLAGDRDCRGLRAGEKRALSTREGLPRWELVAVNSIGVKISDTPTGLKYTGAETVPLFTLKNSAAGENPPATPRLEWRREYQTGEGKARELDSARRVAVWPEATDSELSADSAELKAALLARLPALLANFRADVEALGLRWESSESDTVGGG